MSKKKIILTIFLVIILIALIAGISTIIVLKKIESDRNYEVEKIDKYDYFILKSNNNYGVIDNKGNTIIDSEYNKIIIPNPTKDVFVCYKDENVTILNSKKEQIFTSYENIEPIKLKNIASDLMYEKSVLKYEDNGKYGLINFEGKALTKPIYDNIDSISYREGELLIKKDDKYGVINIKGKTMVKPVYDNIISDDYYNDEYGYKLAGYIVGNKTNEGFKYGYINNKGKIELEIEYNEVSRIIDIDKKDATYIVARKNGQYGLLKNGKELLGYEYQSIEYDIDSDIFILEKTKRYGIANLEGKVTIPVEYTDLQIKGNYIYVEKQENQYIYDKSGNQLNIDFNKSILDTSNENYKITITVNDDKTLYGVIDLNNNQIIEEKYLYLEYAFNNYFIVCGEDGKLGVIDDKGNIVIDLNYDVVEKVQDKNIIQVSVTQTNTTKVYSSQMEKVVELNNATLENEKDYLKIYNGSELKYFDKDGNIIENTKILGNKLFATKQEDKWGFVDKNNDVKVNPDYERTTDFNKYGFAAIKKDNKWGAINENGEIVIEPTYKFTSNQEPDFIGKYYKVQYEFGEFYYTDAINE